jgi:FkbM family methyltransferase
MNATQTAVTERDAWSIHTASGLRLRLPPSMASLSTFVMLEQERWFEPEMSLLPLLLEPGTHALDIGANHGIYTLEIARCAPAGRIWAFEPTAAPRSRLRRSVEEAGLGGRVVVVDAALAECQGEASFAVHDNSELNSRSGSGSRRERVRLLTLDGYLEAQAPDLRFDFVKLDAEGDELRVLAGARRFLAAQSPVVMFEYHHGSRLNGELLAVWQDLGFEIFRWSAELELLLPFDAPTGEAAFALNLVAVRPEQQASLGARGLLVTAQALAAARPGPAGPAALQAWCQRPALRGLEAATARRGGEVYAQALQAVAAAHLERTRLPADRVAWMLAARDSVLQGANAGLEFGAEAWVLAVHCLQALGQQQAAVEMAAQILERWPAGLVLDHPFMPPQRGDAERARSSDAASWLHQLLAEFVALRASHSSYFTPPAPQRWSALLEHPDHGAEIERRFLLAHVRSDSVAPVDRLRLLPDPAHTANPFIWQGLIQAMRALAPSPGVPAPALDAAGLLATLPVAAVSIVDVGASSLGHDSEPYAPLVHAGRARVTGFEPDAAALAQLRQSFPDAGTHHYLPHFVGDGGPAVFHETEWPLTASLLEPNRELLDRYHRLGELVREKARHAVTTVRLDEVIAPGGMDVLKIDVQGAERQVFDGARQRLDECLVVWTEVEFVPLYRGQPLFGDIDARLREHGLQLLGFAGLAHRTLASWPLAGLAQPRQPQILWADAIYIPTPARIAALTAAAAARLALVAHHMLAAFDVCHAALQRHDAVAGSDFAPRYQAALAATPARAG